MLRVKHHVCSNQHGWLLSLRQTFDDSRLQPDTSPLLIIPGYGMNSFIFSYHPRGPSMEASLALSGFDVWSVDLRGQGRACSVGGSSCYHLRDLALVDLPAAVAEVRESTATRSNTVDLIGCSLGASLAFAYLALRPDAPVRRLVSMGGAVRWVQIHPLIRAAFSMPSLVRFIPVRGTRAFAQFAIPKLRRVPWILSMYLHPDIVDLSHADILARTVEDPNRYVNEDIARWICDRDLHMDGVSVSERMGELRVPLLTVIANGDGIVPRETAIWPHHHVASERRDLLEVGSPFQSIAHADMFISDHAPELVFEPLASWLSSS